MTAPHAQCQPGSARANWTPEQFWEYADGLLGTHVRDQMRDMMASQGLALSAPKASVEPADGAREALRDLLLEAEVVKLPDDEPVCISFDNISDFTLTLGDLRVAAHAGSGVLTSDVAGMPWEPAETAQIDFNAYYVVKNNGDEWRDFDLCILRGQMVQHKLAPNYVRGRPEWIAKIDRPAAAPLERCPTCDSPDPARHPAVQFEGEVQLCSDGWHAPLLPSAHSPSEAGK
jgi:hypothetical protein